MIKVDEDWDLDFDKMKLILKIVFDHVKQMLINRRREAQSGLDYKKWEEIHYQIQSKQYPEDLFDPILENANKFLELEDDCLKLNFH